MLLMEVEYNRHKKFLQVAAIVIGIIYGISGLILFGLAIQNRIFIIVSLLMFTFSAFAILYFIGFRKHKDAYMIPFLVIEIVWRVIYGFALCGIWVCFVMAAFGLIKFEVSLDPVTPTEILLLTSILASLIFLALIKLLLIFYKGYRIIKKANDRKRMYGSEFWKMKASFTGKPTSL